MSAKILHLNNIIFIPLIYMFDIFLSQFFSENKLTD